MLSHPTGGSVDIDKFHAGAIYQIDRIFCRVHRPRQAQLRAFGTLSLAAVYVHDDYAARRAVCERRHGHLEPALLIWRVARVVKLKTLRVTAQDRSNPSRRMTRLGHIFATCTVANLQVVDADAVSLPLKCVRPGKSPPRVIHRNNYALLVEQSDGRRQRIEDARLFGLFDLPQLFLGFVQQDGPAFLI